MESDSEVKAEGKGANNSPADEFQLNRIRFYNQGNAFCTKELKMNIPAQYQYTCDSDSCKVLMVNDVDYKIAFDRIMFQYRMELANQMRKIKTFETWS